jgi:hypothetical protein
MRVGEVREAGPTQGDGRKGEMKDENITIFGNCFLYHSFCHLFYLASVGCATTVIRVVILFSLLSVGCTSCNQCWQYM